jgi:signal transduction histidine kinase
LPQLSFDRISLGRFRPSFLPALLIVALAVTGTVTLHAYRASKEHRAVVERVLAAYVSFAAQRVQHVTQDGVFSCAEYWLIGVIKSDEPSRTQVRLDACRAASSATFELDLRQQKVISADGIGAELVSWLLDTIPAHPANEVAPNRLLATLVTPTSGKVQLASYIVQLQDRKPVKAIGLISDDAFAFIEKTALSMVLVPELKVDAKLLDFFSVQYGHPAQHPRKAAESTHFSTAIATDLALGGLPIVVGLRNSGLNVLAPGGLPPHRGWEFLSLFAIAAGLVASALLLRRREAQLVRTRANFVSGVSHELRTPLAQIRMFAEMLLLGRVRNEADRRRSLEIIDTEARRLSHLVENVLQVARSEHGHTRVNPIVMPLAPIVRECVETFSVLAQARGIDFRMELQEELLAPVDSAALRQIVLNLLDNAAKYGPDGQRVVIGVALYDDTARFWVDDEGTGIPARDRERVFDAFYRARDAQHTTGSGIGLSVVRELVVLHGGNTWIEDAPDAGTRVVVQFPGAYLATQQQQAGDFAVA